MNAVALNTLVDLHINSIRHDWTQDEAEQIYHLPLADLIFLAQTRHRQFFKPNEVQLSSLLNIKTGGCPEDCGYCPQSAQHSTALKPQKLMNVDYVIEAAKNAQAQGATRFCMGAAWRSPKEKDFAEVLQMIASVKELGMETCATLGMVNSEQAQRLKSAGLDYYNHNLDTSENYYPEIITTRTYQDRLETLEHVRSAEINVCCGGIIGLGETVADRCAMLVTLANLPKHPESVPINSLVKVTGTPLEDAAPLESFAMVRTIALARIMMPASYIRLSAGRTTMNDEHQTLCFLAGANSVFYGDRLLTTDNPEVDHDQLLFKQLGIVSQQ